MAPKKRTNYDAVPAEAVPTVSADEFTQEFMEEAVQDSIRWIVWYLRRLVQADEIFNKELYKKYAVSQPQLTCLLALREYGPLPTSKLAKYILVNPSDRDGHCGQARRKGLGCTPKRPTGSASSYHRTHPEGADPG